MMRVFHARQIKSILSLGLTALFFVISAVLVILFIPGTIRPLSVQTGSMEPNLSPGDLVLVKKAPVQEYQPGDVITFVNPVNREQTITHRIAESSIKDDHGVFVTKGDANASADQPINEMLIVGEVVGSAPHLGRLIDFLHSWPGLILLIYMPALLIMGAEMRKLTAYYRSIKPYQLYSGQSKHMGAMPLMIAAGVGIFALTGGIAGHVAAQATFVASTGNTISTKAVPAPTMQTPPEAVLQPDEPGEPKDTELKQDQGRDYTHRDKRDGPRHHRRR